MFRQQTRNEINLETESLQKKKTLIPGGVTASTSPNVLVYIICIYLSGPCGVRQVAPGTAIQCNAVLWWWWWCIILSHTHN